MKKSTLLLFLAFVLAMLTSTQAQNVKFGKVSKQELEEKFYPIDSSANAAILYKKRRTHYEYYGNEGWKLITKVHERIKLYNKEGFDWATKQIKLYNGGDDEKVSIKAQTFNLNGGKIEKVKLKGSEIFKEEINKYWTSKKFTMPNIKEGSIVEWEYTISSPYHSNIDDMVFQYKIPLKYIDTQIKIPEYFKFKYTPSFFYPVKVNQVQKNRSLNFTYRQKDDNRVGGRITTSSQNAKVDIYEMVYSAIEKDIPALKEEPFINNLNNYRCKTSFEYTAYTPKYGAHKYYNNTWDDVVKTIYKSVNFGGQLEKSAYFKDDLNTAINISASENEKIVTILQFLKKKIKWDGYYGKYTSKGVKKAYKEGTGNVAEVNLTLVAMLREAGLNANPILVSTRSHGIPLFPTTDGFNYVIAGVEVQNNVILLDATEEYSQPNILPLRDLNWEGRIVRKNGSSTSINLFPKKHSLENILINVALQSDGTIENGLKRITYNNLNALNIRKKHNSLSNDELISALEENDGFEIVELKSQNEHKLGKPLIRNIKFDRDDNVDIIGSKMYISPMLFQTQKENPFKLDERKFPVDFGAPWEDRCRISIKIPEGYTVESLPEKMAIGLPDNLGSFRFLITHANNKINVMTSFKINLPIIAPQYYESLKEFYKKFIEKQAEKIVLSKV